MKSEIVTVLGKKLITAMDIDSGVVFVAMKPLIEGMGLDWSGQRKKIVGDNRYRHMSIPYDTSSGVQEMLSLATDHLPAFLYSINPNKIREDLRDKIIAFQSETFAVINSYWREKRVSERLSSKPLDDKVLAERDRLKDELLQAQRDLIIELQRAKGEERPDVFNKWMSDEETETIIRRYRSGETIAQIARSINRTRGGVSGVLRRAGIK